MSKLKSLMQKIGETPILFSLISSFLTLFLGTIVYRPFFEENDDVTLALITEGAFGKHDYHMVYCNVILGKLTEGLSILISGVRWHTVLQYLFVFLAMIIASYVLAHYRNGRMMAVFMELACFYELYVSFQYTKNAVFISAVGIYAILHHLHLKYRVPASMIIPFSKKGKRFVLVMGYILLLYGMLLRDSAFYIGVVLALIPAFFDFICKISKTGIRKMVPYVCYIAPVFVVLLLCTFVDNAVYNSNPGWSYFCDYNEARTQIADYKYFNLEYDKYGDELSELGISENDAYLYLTHQYADESVVDIDLYNAITAIDGRKIDIDLIKAWVADIYNDVFRLSPIVLAFGMMLLIILISSRSFSLGFLTAFGEAFLVTLMSFYYEFSGRWNHRLIYSTLLGGFVMLLLFYAVWDDDFYESGGRKRSSMSKTATLTIAIGIGLVAFASFSERLGNEFDYQSYLRNEKDFTVLQMYMEEKKDTLFVLDTFTAANQYTYDVFNPVEQGALDNFVSTGGWLTASPIMKDIVSKYGYEDPFDALKHGDNVILVDNTCPDRKAIYLSDHGAGPRYAAEFIETICGYNLYRIN